MPAGCRFPGHPMKMPIGLNQHGCDPTCNGSCTVCTERTLKTSDFSQAAYGHFSGAEMVDDFIKAASKNTKSAAVWMINNNVVADPDGAVDFFSDCVIADIQSLRVLHHSHGTCVSDNNRALPGDVIQNTSGKTTPYGSYQHNCSVPIAPRIGDRAAQDVGVSNHPGHSARHTVPP